MIEAHAVVQLERAAQAGKPPYVSVFAHMIPVVGGIAPNLSGGRETIRRDSRDLVGHAVLAE